DGSRSLYNSAAEKEVKCSKQYKGVASWTNVSAAKQFDTVIDVDFRALTMSTEPTHFNGDPADTRLIREELQRILAGSSFRSSKRCSEFLCFVVERTLEGRGDDLKERTLGVSLFGRPA